MTELDAMNWEWYASDSDGFIAVFTTAGMRRLPTALRHRVSALHNANDYFLSVAPKISRAVVSRNYESYTGFLPSETRKQQYLQDFVEAAESGLFSYDTEARWEEDANYFQVVSPTNPIHLSQLPDEIRQTILVRPSLLFVRDTVIASRLTADW